MKTLKYQDELSSEKFEELITRYRIAFPNKIHSFERFDNKTVEIKILDESLTLENFMEIREKLLLDVIIVLERETPLNTILSRMGVHVPKQTSKFFLSKTKLSELEQELEETEWKIKEIKEVSK